jgi:hypothetical protein
MTRLTSAAPTLRRSLVALVFATAAFLTSSPAGAQYGGGVDLFVDPARVPIDGTFDYFGSNCPAGSTVTITIDGIPGVVDSTVAFDDSSYAGNDVGLPAGVVAGLDYTVRASCGGDSDTAVIRAVCNGGTDPVDGACPDGQTVGGQDPTATTTTIPGSGGDGVPGSSGGTGGNGGTTPDLAVTGASFVEQTVQIGITLISLGALLLLFTGKRRDRAVA